MNDALQQKVDRITNLAYEDVELYAKLTSLTTADELMNFCREQGIEVTAEEAESGFSMLQQHLDEGQSHVLSDAELERIAAGSSACSCPQGGAEFGKN